MSYSFNDNIYADTNTNIITLKGNLDILNTVRFAKTETEEGVSIQANIIKDRLEKGSTQLTVDNFLNSNQLRLQWNTIVSDNTSYNLLLNISNVSLATCNLTIASKTISIGPKHHLCLKMDYPTLNTTQTYLPYSSTTVYNLGFASSNQYDYFVGYSSGSNILTESFCNLQRWMERPTGYYLQNQIEPFHYKSSWHLFSDESYFTGICIHSNQVLLSGVYKNTTRPSGVSIQSIEGNIVHPGILPLTYNSYYPFVFGHSVSSNELTFFKYLKSQGNTGFYTFPKVIGFNEHSFLMTALMKVDPLLPIETYTYTSTSNDFIKDPLVSISGTSLANNYEYVLMKFKNAVQASYEWSVRIVLNSINLTIPDPIQVISHENGDITVTIVNNQLTDVFIYNTDRSTTVLTQYTNIILRFSSIGVYKWAVKLDPMVSNTSYTNVLHSYSNNTFFIHASYDRSTKPLINFYNSDGTTFSTLNTTQQNLNSSLLYYNENGRINHVNRTNFTYPSTFTGSIQSIFSTGSNQSTLYGLINTYTLCNVQTEYIDAFLTNTSGLITANALQMYSLNYSQDPIGKKQLNMGESIQQIRMNADQLTMTGSMLLDRDMSLQQLYTQSNIYMASGARLGIGTTDPRFGIDNQTNAFILGNVGIGTTTLSSKLTLQSYIQDPLFVQNVNPVNLPDTSIINIITPGFSPNYYWVSNSIDPSVDIKEIPPPGGANYLMLQDFTANSKYNASSSNGDLVAYNGASAFDKNSTTRWRSQNNRYNSNTGLPTTTVSTNVRYPNNTSSNIIGEWVQIDLPKEYTTKPTMRLSLYNYTISRDINNVGVPMSWMIVGSNDVATIPEEWPKLFDNPYYIPNDDIGWSFIERRDNYVLTSSSSNFTLSSPSSNYGHYRMIVTKVTSGYTYCSIGELYYYMNIRFRSTYPAYNITVSSLPYSVSTNSFYNFFYNDRHTYLPLVLLNGPEDETYTLNKYWRSGSLYRRTGTYIPSVIELYYPQPFIFDTYQMIGQQEATMPTDWRLDYYGAVGSGSNWMTIDTRKNALPTNERYHQIFLPTQYHGKAFRFSFSNNNSVSDNYLELKRLRMGYLNINTALKIEQDDRCYLNGGVGIGTMTTNTATSLAVQKNSYFYGDVSFGSTTNLRGIVNLAYDGENTTRSGVQGHRGVEWYFGLDNRWGFVHDSVYNLAMYTSTTIVDTGTQEGSAITFNRAKGVDNNFLNAFQEYGRFHNNGNFGIGTTRPAAKLHVSSTGTCNVILNRSTNGNLIDFQVNNVTKGNISVNGEIVSYNTFTGGHWSQLETSNQPYIPLGTVMSSIDQYAEWKLDTWYGDSNIYHQMSYFGPCNVGYIYYDSNQYLHTILQEDNTYLCKCEISHVYQDKRVYGVFSHWDSDGDMVIHSVGTSSIRVTGPCQGGDLLMSKGDGTAIPQEDDLIRSYTIGKVTIGTWTSNDTIHLVPCVLYCG